MEPASPRNRCSSFRVHRPASPAARVPWELRSARTMSSRQSSHPKGPALWGRRGPANSAAILRRRRHSVFATIVDGLSFAECLRWRNGRLYVSDRCTRRILSVSADGGVETYARTPGVPSGIGFLPDGRLLIASMRERKVLRRERDGSIVEHADLSAFIYQPKP